MVLAHARYGEGSVRSTLGLQQHLPEPRGEVQRRKDVASGSADLANAFSNVSHGVLVDVCLLIESPEILH